MFDIIGQYFFPVYGFISNVGSMMGPTKSPQEVVGPTTGILQENGDFLLLETGDFLLQE